MKEKNLKRINGLLADYGELRKKAKSDDLRLGCTDSERKSFAVNALAAIMAIAPKDSPHFMQSHDKTTGNHTSIANLKGILEALKSEIEAGHLMFEMSGSPRKKNVTWLERFHSWNLRTEIKVALIGLAAVVIAAVVTGIFLIGAAFVPIMFGSKNSAPGKTEIYNVNSNYQAGGVTAGVVNVGKQARHLTAETMNQLNASLPKDKKVIVTAVMGDQEAFQFADEVKNYLKTEGWKVDGVDQAIYNKPVKGQSIQKKNDESFELIIGSQV